MTIHRLLPFAAAMLLGGCVTGYTYQSGDGSGDYYYGNPRVEYRYHTPTGVYGSYSPYSYYGGYYGGYSGYYGAWDPYRHSRYYVGPRYYHGPYMYGPYGNPYGYGPNGYPYGYSSPGPQQRVIYRQPRPNHPYRPRNVIRPTIGATPPPPPPSSPPPQSTPTPRSQGNAGEGRAERARIRSQGREE
jgi:hypothetical protein